MNARRSGPLGDSSDLTSGVKSVGFVAVRPPLNVWLPLRNLLRALRFAGQEVGGRVWVVLLLLLICPLARGASAPVLRWLRPEGGSRTAVLAITPCDDALAASLSASLVNLEGSDEPFEAVVSHVPWRVDDSCWVLLHGWPEHAPDQSDLLLSGRIDGSLRSWRLPWSERRRPATTDVVLVVDDSHSMRRTDPERLRVKAVETFARQAANRVDISSLSIVAFNRQARVLLPPTEGVTSAGLADALAGLKAAGRTDMDAGLRTACEQLTTRSGDRGAIVLLSDGRDEPGYYEEAHRRCREQGWPVHTVGLTELADQAVLQRIADETGGTCFLAPTAAQLPGIFEMIALSLDRQGLVVQEWLPAGDALEVPLDRGVRSVSFLWLGAPGAAGRIRLPSGDVWRTLHPGSRSRKRQYAGPPDGVWRIESIGGAGGWIQVNAAGSAVVLPFPARRLSAGRIAVAACVVDDSGPLSGLVCEAESAHQLSEPMREQAPGLYVAQLPRRATTTIRILAHDGGGHLRRLAVVGADESLPAPARWTGSSWSDVTRPPVAVVTVEREVHPGGMGNAIALPVERRTPGAFPTSRDLVIASVFPPTPISVETAVTHPVRVAAPRPLVVVVDDAPAGGHAPEGVSWRLWLVLLLLALLLLGFYRWLLADVERRPIVAYVALSVLVHAAAFVLFMDVLVETGTVELEQVAPAIAVHIRAIEENLGVELVRRGERIAIPDAPPTAMAAAAEVQIPEGERAEQPTAAEPVPEQTLADLSGSQRPAPDAPPKRMETVALRQTPPPPPASEEVDSPAGAIRPREEDSRVPEDPAIRDVQAEQQTLPMRIVDRAVAAPTETPPPVAAVSDPVRTSVKQTPLPSVERRVHEPERAAVEVTESRRNIPLSEPVRRVAESPAIPAPSMTMADAAKPAIRLARNQTPQPTRNLPATTVPIREDTVVARVAGAGKVPQIHRTTAVASSRVRHAPADVTDEPTTAEAPVHAAPAARREASLDRGDEGALPAIAPSRPALSLPVSSQDGSHGITGVPRSAPERVAHGPAVTTSRPTSVRVSGQLMRTDAPLGVRKAGKIEPTGAVAVSDPAADRHIRRRATGQIGNAQHEALPAWTGLAAPRVGTPEGLADARGRVALPTAEMTRAGAPSLQLDAPDSPTATARLARDGAESDLSFRLGGQGEGGTLTLTMAVARYGGDWNCSPTAMLFLGHQLEERTGTAIEVGDAVVQLDSPKLRELPFIYLTGHTDFTFSAAEIAALHTYLKGGGNLWVDDSTHFNDTAFDRAFRREIQRVLPDTPLERLGRDFAGFTTGYDLSRGYLGYAIPPGDKYRLDYLEGVSLNGRVAVVYTRNDYGDGLNIDPRTHPLKMSLTNLSPAEMQEGAVRMGVNLVLYFLSNRLASGSEFVGRVGSGLDQALPALQAVVPDGAVEVLDALNEAEGWQPEAWGDGVELAAAKETIEMKFEVARAGKAVITREWTQPLSLKKNGALVVDAVNRLSCGVRLAVGVTLSDQQYFESQPFFLKPGQNAAVFPLDGATFKCEATDWEFSASLPSDIKVSRLSLLVYSPRAGVVDLSNLRWIH